MSEEEVKKPNAFIKFWISVKEWAFKYIGGLFMEEKNGDGKKVISIGRCLLIVVVIAMIRFWETWMGAMTLTPEMLAQAVVEALPENSTATGVDVLAASAKVVEALPTAAPPLLGTAFMTACGYVFGSKVKNAVGKKFGV
jgi:hypothetical protein